MLYFPFTKTFGPEEDILKYQTQLGMS